MCHNRGCNACSWEPFCHANAPDRCRHARSLTGSINISQDICDFCQKVPNLPRLQVIFFDDTKATNALSIDAWCESTRLTSYIGNLRGCLVSKYFRGHYLNNQPAMNLIKRCRPKKELRNCAQILPFKITKIISQITITYSNAIS